MMLSSDVAFSRLEAPFPIFEYDCGEFLSYERAESIARCATVFANYGRLNGESPTSRQRQLGYSKEDRVGTVTGSTLALKLPWLDAFYRIQVTGLINSLGEGEFFPSSDQKSGVNINILTPGNSYEWHVDTNPLTALLFVTTHLKETGGELVFKPDPICQTDESWEIKILPRRGRLLVFDARKVAHAVRPVSGEGPRISVPMNFYRERNGLQRPDHLDRYLYGSQS